jgi:hypothetical protein
MHSEDPDRAAISARRQRFILLALTGAVASSTACRSSAQPCLSIGYPGDPDADPVTTVCPAVLGDPVSLLSGSQIRLPQGLTPEAIVAVPPNAVALNAPVESVSCIDGIPGGMISYFAMIAIPDDQSKSLPALRDELLAIFGYGASSFSDELTDEAARSYQVVLDLPPAAADAEPARALLRLQANAGRIYAVIYGAHPDAWNALQASLRASAASLSFPSP